MPDSEILEEAARWHARLLAPDCSAQDRVRFEAWRGDSRHARAYAAAERLAESLPRLAASDARLQALAAKALSFDSADYATPPPGSAPAAALLPKRQRKWAVPAALTASILLGASGLRLLPVVQDMATPTLSYATAPGERKSFPLADGSVIHADVGSRLTVRLGKEGREVELLSGRALFDVAHDSSRPFSVQAGTTRTVALGTRFQVQNQDRSILVTLAEGSIAVAGTAGNAPWQERLVPGEQIAFNGSSAFPEKRTVDPQLVTSWSRGRHLFRGTPLGEAIGEINRYATIKIRLGDPTLADLPVGGNFIAGDSELIVSALASMLPIRVVEGSDEIVLFRSHDTGT